MADETMRRETKVGKKGTYIVVLKKEEKKKYSDDSLLKLHEKLLDRRLEANVNI